MAETLASETTEVPVQTLAQTALGGSEVCPIGNASCRYFDMPGGCRTDTHHIYWPRAAYLTQVEKQFRRLPENVVEGICRAVHDEIHATRPAPQKPSRDFMISRINAAKELRNGGF